MENNSKSIPQHEEKVKIFTGNIIHCIEAFSVHTIENGFIIIRGKKIVAVDNLSKLEEVKQSLCLKEDVEITQLTDTQFLVPGLIDTHIHGSQYPNVGLGYDKQLLEWLSKYTFPLEARFKKTDFAKKVYKSVVKRTLAHGTTTACYFATVHLESSLILAKEAITLGQRAFVGKVNMTNLCPANLQETEEESISNTEKFVKAVLDEKSDLVRPIITPRFALSCNMSLMKKLSQIAKKYDVHIQTHISENLEEIDEVEKIFHKKYADVYDEAGLLTNKTILAHAVHLQPDEINLLAQRGTSVSHCPASNSCLQSGMCNVRRLIHDRVTVGLGTDVSGGPSPSIIEAMRQALCTSVNLCTKEKDYIPLNCYDVFYLATLGGAKALAMDDKIGNFQVGKEFDALIIDMKVKDSAVDFLHSCNALELLQKFIYTGDDRNVVQVFVAGKKVK